MKLNLGHSDGPFTALVGGISQFSVLGGSKKFPHKNGDEGNQQRNQRKYCYREIVVYEHCRGIMLPLFKLLRMNTGQL